MPAPAVYVIAVVGTVGVAIAFKEFIYPHLAPRIDRWKAEYQAAKRRRAEAEISPEVSLTQQGADKDGYHNHESYSDHSDTALGKGSSPLRPTVHPYLKDGLLIRRCSGETSPSNSGDVELDWITSKSTATETASQQQDLRLRKNNGSLTETQMKSSYDFELKKTTETQILDNSIQAIPYTPLSPVRTPTPTRVLYNSSSPLDSPFSTKVSLQPPSPSCTMANPSASNAESFPPSPPGLAVPDVAPFRPVSVDGTRIPDNSSTSLPSLVPLSSPSDGVLSSLHPQLLSPTWSHPSPNQTPPHIDAIPSLSQSYPLDDVFDYEHGLELLSPPSPLSRSDSPFELTGLSPRLGLVERSTMLARSGDSMEQFSAAPTDGVTNSTSSTTYVSFSSPALSASSVSPSENGYENDFSPSEISSTFSSPFVEPTRLGDLGSEFLPPHDQVRLNLSMPPLSSGSFDVNHPPTRSQESDTRRSIISFNDNVYDDYADTQTLSLRNRNRSPSVTETVATTLISTEIHSLGSAARLSRLTTSDSDFGTGSELSDLFMSAGESTPAAASSSVGVGSRSVVYTGPDGSGAGGIGGPRIEDGNESDTSSWSLAGGSE